MTLVKSAMVGGGNGPVWRPKRGHCTGGPADHWLKVTKHIRSSSGIMQWQWQRTGIISPPLSENKGPFQQANI